jgi:hypothetical protein
MTEYWHLSQNAEIAVSDSTNSWSIPITIIDTSGDIVTRKGGQISAGLIPFAGGLTKQFNTKTKVTTHTSNGVIEDYLNKIGLRTPEVSINTTTYPNNTAVIETREG